MIWGRVELEIRGRSSRAAWNRNSLTFVELKLLTNWATSILVRSCSVPLVERACLVVGSTAVSPRDAAFNALFRLMLPRTLNLWLLAMVQSIRAKAAHAALVWV